MFTAEELEAKSEEGKRQNPIAWLLGRGIGLLFLGVWRFVRLFWSSLLYLAGSPIFLGCDSVVGRPTCCCSMACCANDCAADSPVLVYYSRLDCIPCSSS